MEVLSGGWSRNRRFMEVSLEGQARYRKFMEVSSEGWSRYRNFLEELLGEPSGIPLEGGLLREMKEIPGGEVNPDRYLLFCDDDAMMRGRFIRRFYL